MFQWTTDEERWDPAGPPDLEPPEPNSARYATLSRYTALLALILLLVTLVAGGLRWRGHHGLARARADLQTTLEQEAWAIQTHHPMLFMRLLDPETPTGWRQQLTSRALHPTAGAPKWPIEITDLVLEQPDLLLVEVRVPQPARTFQREARAYRRIGPTWMRTTPPTGLLWVQQSELETSHLRLVFHQADTELVKALMPALQQLYAQLLKDLHLSPPTQKRTLEIVRSVQPASRGLDDPNLFDLSYLPPEADTPTLTCFLGGQLVNRVFSPFDLQAGYRPILLNGLASWELHAWSPACTYDVYAHLATLLFERPFIPLSFLTSEQLDARPASLGHSFIDYYTLRYGRARLGNLFTTMLQHDTWPALIEALGADYVDVASHWWEYVMGRTRPYMPPGIGGPVADPYAVEKAIQWMLNLESQAVQTGDLQLFRLLFDPEDPQQWHQQVREQYTAAGRWGQKQEARIERLTLNDSYTEVRVVTDVFSEGGIEGQLWRVGNRLQISEVRTYRDTAGRWVWTAPIP